MSVHISITHLRYYRFLLLSLAFLAMTIMPTFAHASAVNSSRIEHQTCGNTSVDIHAVGTGMMMGFKNLTTSLPRLDAVIPSEGCAAISWDTSAPAATFIVVTEFGNNPLAVDISKENYGYTLASPQDNSGNAYHTAIISGLQPGKTYAYRLVSRAFPTAIPVVSEARILIVPTQDYATPIKSVNRVNQKSPTIENSKTALIENEITSTHTATNSINDYTENKTAPSSVNAKETASTKSLDKIPSAIAAASIALDGETHEKALFKNLQENVNSFIKRYGAIIGNANKTNVFLFVLILLLGIGYVLYTFYNKIIAWCPKNLILYWLAGSAILAVVSATITLYYVSLLSIALFLGILAWYLLGNMPPLDDTKDSPSQPKLLESSKRNKEYTYSPKHEYQQTYKK